MKLSARDKILALITERQCANILEMSRKGSVSKKNQKLLRDAYAQFAKTPPVYRKTKRNIERAKTALRALDAYRGRKKDTLGLGKSDIETVRDLLQDILHWLKQIKHPDPIDALNNAVEIAVEDWPNEWEGK